MRCISAIAISVFSIALLSQHAQAQGFDAVALDVCLRAVDGQVKSSHPNASNLDYANAKTSQVEMQTNVKGKGHFDGDHGKTEFSYSCVYNLQSGDASNVHVTMSGTTASN